MKNYRLIAIILGIMFVFSAVSAKAQKSQMLITQIPFEFSAGDKIFAPGKYVITRLNPNSDSVFLHLRRYDEKANIILPTVVSTYGISRKKDQPALKFTRYGDRYFLSGVFNPAEQFSAEIRKSKMEIQLAKEFTKRKIEITKVILPEN